MSPMYAIKPRSRAGRQPGGRTHAYLLGDILANRTAFTTQHVSRDRRRVETTPDHILITLWRTGGYTGEIKGQPITYGGGTVVLSDRRRTLEGTFIPADTMGLVVPRSLFAGLDLETKAPRFDPARNRLLSARIALLYRQLPHTAPSAVPGLRAELVAFLRRILDSSQAADVLEGRELDHGLFAVAARIIEANLGHPDLTAETLAAAVGISRATLYRLFAPVGGVMHFIIEQRLLAIRDALMDPMETRSLTRLAADHGIASLSHLSRSFRTRFDVTPRAWRAQHTARVRAQGSDTHEPFWRWFHNLGQHAAEAG